jgi:hypothetical protein
MRFTSPAASDQPGVLHRRRISLWQGSTGGNRSDPYVHPNASRSSSTSSKLSLDIWTSGPQTRWSARIPMRVRTWTK